MNNLEFTVSETCLTCSHKFNWGEPLIIKAPEGACFCQNCWGKHPDEKKYDGKYECWLTHTYGGKDTFTFGPEEQGKPKNPSENAR